MWRYVGDGTEFLEGVPMRDLEDDQFALLSDEQQAAVQASPLYSNKPLTVPKPAPAPAPDPAPTGGTA